MFRRKGKDEDEEKEDQKAWFYASYILKNPEEIDGYPGRYLIVADNSMILKGHCFTNMPRALNLLAEKGWRLVSYELAGVTNVLIGHAILEKQHVF